MGRGLIGAGHNGVVNDDYEFSLELFGIVYLGLGCWPIGLGAFGVHVVFEKNTCVDLKQLKISILQC